MPDDERREEAARPPESDGIVTFPDLPSEADTRGVEAIEAISDEELTNLIQADLPGTLFTLQCVKARIDAEVAKRREAERELDPIRQAHGTVTHMLADWDQLADALSAAEAEVMRFRAALERIAHPTFSANAAENPTVIAAAALDREGDSDD